MGRVIVACIRNCFDPLTSREIREFEPGKSIREMADDFYPEGSGDYHVEIALDGRRIDDPAKFDLIPGPGASVALCAVPEGGGGKNPLAIVAALALVVAAPYLAPALGVAAGVGSTLVTAGAMVAGGLLIQAVFPVSTPDAGPNQLASSPTYSWDPAGNLIAEGGALPEIFGVHRVVPPVIARFVDVSGDKQYLNYLFAVAGHPLDSISEVRINGNPIESFMDVTYDVRLGAVDQAVIPGFEKIRIDVPVGAKLQYHADPDQGWTKRITQGNVVDRFGVVIGFPKGLYNVSGGSVGNVSVKVYLEYRLKTDGDTETWIRASFPNIVPITVTTGRWSGGYWTMYLESDPLQWIEIEAGSDTPGDHTEGDPFAFTGIGYEGPYAATGVWHWLETGTEYGSGTTSVDYIEVNEASTNPIYRNFFLLNDVTPGQYEIRCRLVDEPATGIEYVQDAYFTSFQEVVNEAQQYPGTAILSVRALATDQLSGSDFTVDCLPFRATVPIYNGATLENRLANSPAWASYYLLNRNGEGVDASRIDYQAFSSWAGKCQARGYEVNLYVDSTGTLRRALDMVALNGRGVVSQLGSKFTCMVDLPDENVVQRFLFTMGNIEADSFTEEWMSTADRANAVEVTYFDKELDYARTTVEIYSDDYDTTDREINKVSVTLFGCTSKDYATRYGKFLLYCNRYLTLVSSWGADVDAIACLPNDPIDVAHDVPQYGESGRIVSYDWGTLEMVIDREVTMEPGTDYIVMIRRVEDDAIDTFAVDAVGVETTTDTFTARLSSSVGPSGGDALDGAIVTETGDGAIVDSTGDGAMVGGGGVAVYAGSVYSFGTVSSVVKQMRVLRISRAGDLRKKLTCMEYVPEIYVDGVTY